MAHYNRAKVAALIQKSRKRGKLVQYAALVYRMRDGKVQVLLVTSRKSQNWILPKGSPIANLKPHQTAAQEAWEEAGVKGRADKKCLGRFRFDRQGRGNRRQLCVGLVYPLQAKKLARNFPEAGQRQRKWLSPKKAARRIANPELSEIVRSFDPRNH